jgi:dihydroneopterin aldolase
MTNYLITSLHDLQLKVILGVEVEERKYPQLIKVSFFLYQSILPQVALNDNAQDYQCYNKLAEKIHDYCQNRQFKLLEFLCYQIHQLIKQSVPQEIEVRVIVEKCKLPMNFEVGSAKCEYSDLGK